MSSLLKILKGDHFDLLPQLPLPQKSPIRLGLSGVNANAVSQKFSPARVSHLHEKIENHNVCIFASPQSFEKKLLTQSKLG